MASDKIQPEFLKPGDTVGIISPSFSIEPRKLAYAVKYLEKWRLKVRIGKNAMKVNGPFGGNEEERLSDFQEMTNDPEIKAVLCSRGGYGLSKIIEKVDFSALKTDPKWYVGFSDITVLHMWLSEVCGVMSVHGDMPLNFSNSKKTKTTFSSLKQVLFGEYQDLEWSGNFFKASDVSGEMTGGNLSLLYSLKGTAAAPSTKGKILFIEEVGEYFYHIDRMLTSLKMAGMLKDLSALVIGGMNKIEESKVPWGRSIEETIFGIVDEYNYPLFFNFPAGHVADNRAFYIGRDAKIKVTGKKATLTFG